MSSRSSEPEVSLFGFFFESESSFFFQPERMSEREWSSGGEDTLYSSMSAEYLRPSNPLLLPATKHFSEHASHYCSQSYEHRLGGLVLRSEGFEVGKDEVLSSLRENFQKLISPSEGDRFVVECSSTESTSWSFLYRDSEWQVAADRVEPDHCWRWTGSTAPSK